MKNRRIFLFVLDSLGIGKAPDAEKFKDGACNTLQSIFAAPHFHVPNLQKLGLFNIEGIDFGEKAAAPAGAFARLQEVSMGKDTTTGHWEIAGIESKTALPLYPNGFPPEIIEALQKASGRKILCNLPYSGTKVLEDYGQQQLREDALIVYTSADSVMQIAAHEEQIAPDELYAICKQARQIMQGPHGVGRIIARPYKGSYPAFERTANRHDFSLEPPAVTMLDVLAAHGYQTTGIGKISDIFAGRAVRRHIASSDNEDGMQKALACQQEDFQGLCFINLVDFDMKYGHRRDITGYAQALCKFDKDLELFLSQMRAEDILMITADHGCDPGAPGTDHTREYVPWLVYGQAIRPGTDLKTLASFSSIAATIQEMFDLPIETAGKSFAREILK